MNRLLCLAFLLTTSASCASQAAGLAPEEHSASNQDEAEPPAWVQQARAFHAGKRKVVPGAFKRQWESLPIASIELTLHESTEESRRVDPVYTLLLSVPTADTAEEVSDAAGLQPWEVGRIAYEGRKNVAHLGDFGSAVTLYEYTRLCLLAQEIDLLDRMRNRGEKGKGASSTLTISTTEGEILVWHDVEDLEAMDVFAFACSVDWVWAQRIRESEMIR
jgi:hypothetical protein